MKLTETWFITTTEWPIKSKLRPSLEESLVRNFRLSLPIISSLCPLLTVHCWATIALSTLNRYTSIAPQLIRAKLTQLSKWNLITIRQATFIPSLSRNSKMTNLSNLLVRGIYCSKHQLLKRQNCRDREMGYRRLQAAISSLHLTKEFSSYIHSVPQISKSEHLPVTRVKLSYDSLSHKHLHQSSVKNSDWQGSQHQCSLPLPSHLQLSTLSTINCPLLAQITNDTARLGPSKVISFSKTIMKETNVRKRIMSISFIVAFEVALKASTVTSLRNACNEGLFKSLRIKPASLVAISVPSWAQWAIRISRMIRLIWQWVQVPWTRGTTFNKFEAVSRRLTVTSQSAPLSLNHSIWQLEVPQLWPNISLSQRDKCEIIPIRTSEANEAFHNHHSERISSKHAKRLSWRQSRPELRSK